MTDQARIVATGVTVAFGNVDVISGVGITLYAGEIQAITGENGAGKSSLAKAIAGVYPLKSGSIRLDDQLVSFRNPREALAAGIALIHQEPLSFPDLEVAENVFAGHYLRRGILADRSACRARTADLLASLGSDLKPTDRVSNLSVAQRQLVELASALAYDAKVWIFDETTAPLTPKEVSELFAVMRRLRDRGCAIAMVSHHLHEVFEISDRITVLRDGVKVAELKTSDSNPQEVVKLMVGRDLEPLPPARTSEVGAGGLLETQNLSGPGFHNISLNVKPGEILGIAGLVGAGRSEFTRALFGITSPTYGSIKIDGKEVRIPNPQAAISLGIALVPEDRAHEGLFLIQSIAFNSTLSSLRRHSRAGITHEPGIQSTTQEYAKRLNLAYRNVHQPVGQLSGGNQQKVVLAKWLSTNPKLLILDEPTRGVDIGAKHEVHTIIRQLASEGIGVLMVSSDLNEILSLSDRVAVMKGGQLTTTMSRSEATEERIMQAATQEEACVAT